VLRHHGTASICCIPSSAIPAGTHAWPSTKHYGRPPSTSTYTYTYAYTCIHLTKMPNPRPYHVYKLNTFSLITRPSIGLLCVGAVPKRGVKCRLDPASYPGNYIFGRHQPNVHAACVAAESSNSDRSLWQTLVCSYQDGTKSTPCSQQGFSHYAGDYIGCGANTPSLPFAV
jgi:hypothetical protein